MAKAKLLYFGLLAAVVLIMVVRLMLPYRIPSAKAVTPEFEYEQNLNGSGGLLEQIFAHNLWSQNRSPLIASESSTLVDKSNEAEIDPALAEENKTWKLVGVSNAEEEPFAIIESEEGVKNYVKGDFLPDGATLNEILAYGIQTTKLGKNERFYLFGKK